VVAGSHDPLLEWALRESGAGLAVLSDGSFDGLKRLAAGTAMAAGIHLPETTATASMSAGCAGIWRVSRWW
jgi:putative molybdopterin biosynthesis protein